VAPGGGCKLQPPQGTVLLPPCICNCEAFAIPADVVVRGSGIDTTTPVYPGSGYLATLGGTDNSQTGYQSKNFVGCNNGSGREFCSGLMPDFFTSALSSFNIDNFTYPF